MGNNLLAIVTMTVAARDETAAGAVVDEVTAHLRHTRQMLAADPRRPGRWTAVLHATDPGWSDDGSDDSLTAAVRAVLRRLRVAGAETVEVSAARPTASAALHNPSAAVEWLLAEVWDNSDNSPEPESEELEGIGHLDPADLAELAAMLDTHLWVQADLRLADPQTSGQYVADLTRRLGDKAVLTGQQRLDGGLLRVLFHLGVTSTDPARAVHTAIGRLSGPAPAGWVVDHGGTSAVWTGEMARPGITRIEVRATHAPG